MGKIYYTLYIPFALTFRFWFIHYTKTTNAFAFVKCPIQIYHGYLG